DDFQQRRLAAPGRSDDRDELTRRDVEGDVAQRVDEAVAHAVHLLEPDDPNQLPGVAGAALRMRLERYHRPPTPSPFDQAPRPDGNMCRAKGLYGRPPWCGNAQGRLPVSGSTTRTVTQSPQTAVNQSPVAACPTQRSTHCGGISPVSSTAYTWPGRQSS